MASAYTEEELDRYLDYITIPPQYHRRANPPKNLELLTALHVYQISTIPYENLSLHYSREHSVPLDPRGLYMKLMANGRGGYCMEVSIFFNHVLRGLGFEAYTAGARIRPRAGDKPQGNYIGWSHIVNIVTLDDGTKYMVDVGFGGDGATKPIPLVDGHVTSNLGSQELRLVYDAIPQQIEKTQKYWIYQYRNNSGLDWNSFYCFSEMEFLQQDFEVMNYFSSKHPFSIHTYAVLVVKFLRRQGEIYGKVMLVNDKVKQNTGGRTSVAKECKNEDERVDALKEDFGIILTDEEREGIRGMTTELL